MFANIKKQILFVLKSRIDIICTIKPCYMITYKDKINWGLDIAPLHKENLFFFEVIVAKIA